MNDVDYAVGLGAIRDLLERNGISPSEVGQLHRIKDVRLYQQGAKVDQYDSEGKVIGQALEVQDLASIVLSPAFEDGPAWPLVHPGPAVKLPPLKTSKAKAVRGAGAWQKAVIFPDMQCGYYHGKDGMVSTHDEQAIDMALSITNDINPDLVVLVGDNLDAPEFGRYRLSNAFAQTTQASIDYLAVFAQRLRVTAPNARIVWIEGNHEARLGNFIVDNAAAAFGIKQGNTPSGWPVMSIPHLCRLDEVGVEYLSGYPANKLWINERLKVIHGNRVKSGGATASLYLANEKTSILYGHIHRREWLEMTNDDWDGPKTIMAASPGCLAKIDGAVPSTKGGTDLFGRPLTVTENWQSGIGVVTYEDTGDHRFFYEQVAFHSGNAMYGGKFYSA